MKKWIPAVLAALLALPLAGCYDSKELDTWAYVYSLGVDKGTTDKLCITVQLATLKGAGGQSPGGQSSGSGQGQSGRNQSDSFTDMSMECASMITGLNDINASLSRTVNLTQVKYIVFSEEFAKDDMGYWIDALARFPQIRRNAYVVIAKGRAGDFVDHFNPVVGTAMAKTQEGQMEQIKITGLAYSSNLFEFINDLKSNKVQPHAVLAAVNPSASQEATQSQGASSQGASQSGASSSAATKTFEGQTAGEIRRQGGNQTEFLGTAIFDGGKLVNELDGDESRVLTMISGRFQNASIALENPLDKKNTVVIKIQQRRKPRIRIGLDTGNPVIDQTIYLEGDIQAVQGETEMDDSALFPLLESELKTELKSECKKTIEKCRKSGCDVFGYGDIASEQFPTIRQWDGYHWLARFKNASVNTNVEFTVRRNGTELKNNPVQTAGGEPS